MDNRSSAHPCWACAALVALSLMAVIGCKSPPINNTTLPPQQYVAYSDTASVPRLWYAEVEQVCTFRINDGCAYDNRIGLEWHGCKDALGYRAYEISDDLRLCGSYTANEYASYILPETTNCVLGYYITAVTAIGETSPSNILQVFWTNP